MRYGIDLPNFGDFADIGLIAEIAATAERNGWDGVFLWDHIGRSTEFPLGLPFADVTVALTAIALATERVVFGPLVTPLPRRRAQKVAREFTSLDHLSNGRIVLGVGIGSPPDSEFEAFGENADARARGDLLDESLDVLLELWAGERVDYDGSHLTVHSEGFDPQPVQRPRIPIWVAARWPSRGRPLRRAARFEAVVPIPAEPEARYLTPEDIAAIRAHVGRDEIDIVLTTAQEGRAAEYEEAGVTWLVDIAGDRASALERATAGPPSS